MIRAPVVAACAQAWRECYSQNGAHHLLPAALEMLQESRSMTPVGAVTRSLGVYDEVTGYSMLGQAGRSLHDDLRRAYSHGSDWMRDAIVGQPPRQQPGSFADE
jgi:hypothetical protein